MSCPNHIIVEAGCLSCAVWKLEATIDALNVPTAGVPALESAVRQLRAEFNALGDLFKNLDYRLRAVEGKKPDPVPFSQPPPYDSGFDYLTLARTMNLPKEVLSGTALKMAPRYNWGGDDAKATMHQLELELQRKQANRERAETDAARLVAATKQPRCSCHNHYDDVELVCPVHG